MRADGSGSYVYNENYTSLKRKESLIILNSKVGNWVNDKTTIVFKEFSILSIEQAKKKVIGQKVVEGNTI